MPGNDDDEEPELPAGGWPHRPKWWRRNEIVEEQTKQNFSRVDAGNDREHLFQVKSQNKSNKRVTLKSCEKWWLIMIGINQLSTLHSGEVH